MLDAVLVVAGLAALIGGAWILVHEAERLAVRLGMSPMLVGLTVVALGTSAPEMIVGASASARGAGELAVGGVLGSNVANVALVLGLGIVMRPLAVSSRLLRWELPALGVATVLVLLFGASGAIGRIEGAALLALLVAFLAVSARSAPESLQSRAAEVEVLAPAASMLRGVVQLLVGIAALAAGSELLVRGAEGLAERLAISQVVVGALVIAVGTSLPELATTAVAALRRQHAIAVGNVIGSNIFNLLGALGLASLVAPLPIDGRLYELELPAMALSTALLVPLAWREQNGRVTGAVLLLAYLLFAVALPGHR